MWAENVENSWFRSEDRAYAGKDHTKNNKTFICIFYDPKKNTYVEKTGFRSLDSAKKYIDDNCPTKEATN